MLQWGRDQLIAELGTGTLVLSAAAALQWGRDQLIAELQLLQELAFWIVHASMGPRSIDRGTLPAQYSDTPAHLLQWGRDQLIAELGRILARGGSRECFNGAAIN